MNEKTPITTFRAGCISAAVWKNSIQSENGETGKDILTVTLDRRYRDNKEWKSSRSLGINDIPKAIVVLQKAFEYLISPKEKEPLPF